MSSLTNTNGGSNGNGAAPRRPTNPLLKRLKLSHGKSKATNAVIVFHVKPQAVVPPDQDEGFKPKQGIAVTVDGYFSTALSKFWFMQKESNGAPQAVREAVKEAIEELGCVKWCFQFTNPQNGQAMRGTNGFPLKGLVWFFEDDEIAQAFTKEAIKEIVMETLVPTICNFQEIEQKSYPIWDELSSYREVQTWSDVLAPEGDGQLPQLWKMTMVGNGKTYGNYGAMLKASKNLLYSFLKPNELTQAYINKYTLTMEHLMPADADRLFPRNLIQQMARNNAIQAQATLNTNTGSLNNVPRQNNNVTPSNLSQQSNHEEETPIQARRLDYNENETNKTNENEA